MGIDDESAKNFRNNVMATAIGTAFGFFGSLVWNPIREQFAAHPRALEGLYALGWFAFLIVLVFRLMVGRRVRVPNIDVVTNYPLVIPVAGKATLIEWRDKNIRGEGGRVDLVGDSIYLELWNGSGGARTQRSRPVTFGRA